MKLNVEVVQHYEFDLDGPALQLLRYQVQKDHGEKFTVQNVYDAFDEWLDARISFSMPRDEEIQSISHQLTGRLYQMVKETEFVRPEIPGQLEMEGQ